MKRFSIHEISDGCPTPGCHEGHYFVCEAVDDDPRNDRMIAETVGLMAAERVQAALWADARRRKPGDYPPLPRSLAEIW